MHMEDVKVLVKGAGEQATAIGHRLFRAGFRLVMTELATPTAVRRTVSFCTAIYEQEVEVEGVRAVAQRREQVVAMAAAAWDHIPVVIDPQAEIVQAWRPEVIVDARILKRNLDNSQGDAPLVIGLGPGLTAGRDVHYVIETNRGHHLGRIIASGMSQTDTGEPGEIYGYTHERVLWSPSAGVFACEKLIGTKVEAGEVIARVAGETISAKITGVLRGVLYPGVEVVCGQKVGDIDPRGNPAYCFTLSDKARTISGSVLELVVSHAGKRSARNS
jgi:xanthine dehydrogenase accessory factor